MGKNGKAVGMVVEPGSSYLGLPSVLCLEAGSHHVIRQASNPRLPRLWSLE